MVASKNDTTVPGVDFEAAAGRIRDLNEQVIEQAKKSGNVSLDAYEKALTSVLDFEKKAAGASQLDFVKALTDAHVNFVSQTSEAYLKAAREVLK
ncbi:hypothetical protein EK0264_08235 [Epidermidibacterium keratini]|uniref:Phasin domain-containing protein n=1 Tax=Epidermidibacterium keratini TaxID=1891644 RepID=A0A7L4YMF7_9ACTN|nr:hypothetical protein [Epidermidibacterium keratini]QHC00268.1 hypothetical protein EK0264_08235 [Epidermidibacterium keratini]